MCLVCQFWFVSCGCCVLLHQADRRDVVCHLVGRGCGKTRVLSNVQCAQAASSGMLVVTKLHARFHFGCDGFEAWSHTSFTHTQLGHTQSFTHTHNFVTHIFHTQLHHTQLFTYNFLTSRSSTTSFVFPSFPVPLQLLFLLIGRSWLVGLSGTLIFGPALWPRNNSQCHQPVALLYFNIFYLCNFTVPGRHSRRGGPKCRRPECPAELHWFGAN